MGGKIDTDYTTRILLQHVSRPAISERWVIPLVSAWHGCREMGWKYDTNYMQRIYNLLVGQPSGEEVIEFPR